MNVTPEEMARITEHYANEIRSAQSKYVAVGLPQEKVGQQIYGDGNTVIKIGAIHEYGSEHNPRRSFLNVPFQIKKDTIDKFIAKQFEAVLTGDKDAAQALGLIGTAAVGISKDAFTTRGYGEWPDIKQSTKTAKGSSQVLIDTGTLRNSITYVIREG